MMLKPRERQGFLAVFLLQQPGVLEWDLDVHAFEEGVPQGEDVAFLRGV